MKIVINRCYGGFGLSRNALETLNVDSEGKVSGTNIFIYDDAIRTYPPLIKLIEEKGAKFVNGSYASLKIVEIPDNIKWKISDYDGIETIEEIHREWY